VLKVCGLEYWAYIVIERLNAQLKTFGRAVVGLKGWL
jgi:hypothetical protein